MGFRIGSLAPDGAAVSVDFGEEGGVQGGRATVREHEEQPAPCRERAFIGNLLVRIFIDNLLV